MFAFRFPIRPSRHLEGRTALGAADRTRSSPKLVPLIRFRSQWSDGPLNGAGRCVKKNATPQRKEWLDANDHYKATVAEHNSRFAIQSQRVEVAALTVLDTTARGRERLKPSGTSDLCDSLLRVLSTVRGRSMSLAGKFSEQEVNIEQCFIHHTFPATELDQRDAGIGTVAPFRGGLDGGEIHPVAVAIAEEEGVLDVRPRLQPVGVVTEKFARAPHQGELAVDQHRVELGGQGIAVELDVVAGDFREIGSLKDA